MMKLPAGVFAVMLLMAGSAFAASPPPNDVGVTGMGGGVYYNPYVGSQGTQSGNTDRSRQVGTTAEGGGLYKTPLETNAG